MNCTTEKILNRLRSAGTHVSSAKLCEELGISRAAIWKHIRHLRELGYEIDSVPNRGYRLDRVLNLPSGLEVKPLLDTHFFGKEIHYLPKTRSTNLVAAEMARDGSLEGTVVTADSQTAGRGRLERQWHSPAGMNLYFSVILRPEVMPNQAPQLALAAGIALCRAIRGLYPELAPRAKWPNDVYLNGRKLAGVLCSMVSEMERVNYLIIGIGVNVNITEFPAEIADIATSLRLATGKEISRPILLAAILRELENIYETWLREGLASMLDEWHNISYLTGQQAVVQADNGPLEGEVLGITENGALRIRTRDSSIREIIGGEVERLHGFE